MFSPHMSVTVLSFCVPNHRYNISLPRAMKTLYERLQLIQWFQRRNRLKMLTDDGQTDDDVRQSLTIFCAHVEASPLTKIRKLVF